VSQKRARGASHRATLAAALLALVLAGCAAAPAASTPARSPSASASASARIVPATLLPDGAWTVDLSSDELAAAGANAQPLQPGTYTWTFKGTHARVSFPQDGHTGECFVQASPAEGGVLFTYLAKLGCGGWTDTIGWSNEADGLHLTLVDSTAPREENAPYLEAKPWQPTHAEPLPDWPDWYARCEPGCHGPMSGATFTSENLLPGLALTFPDGDWFNSADHEEEIEFDIGETALRIWRAPLPVSSSGEPSGGVPESSQELLAAFSANPGMVVSAPTDVTLGEAVPATTFTLRVSDDNQNADPDCPAGVRSCLNVLWIAPNHVFAIGYGSGERFWTFTLADGTFMVVSLDAPDQATLDELTPAVEAILATLRLPA
jgi:hypothetical protein